MVSTDDIRAARERLGESQSAFGERFGVDQSTVHRWETAGIPARGTTRIAVEKILSELPPTQSPDQPDDQQQAHDGSPANTVEAAQ